MGQGEIDNELSTGEAFPGHVVSLVSGSTHLLYLLCLYANAIRCIMSKFERAPRSWSVSGWAGQAGVAQDQTPQVIVPSARPGS